jgi:GT2 family glycosyltransferase
VIPNWNGERLLRKNLLRVISSLHRRSEVIVVDDGSTDGSVRLVQSSKFKVQSRKLGINLRLVKNVENRGFIYSCNRGMKEARGEFVVLLNNDVVPKKGFLEAALAHFRDPKVFAVSFNEQQFGWAKIWWRGGFIHHGAGGRPNEPHITAWASGGSAVFRKSIWEKLGGFDPLYHPFYWEDFDLGYRAWKAGYKIIWEPKAVVEHRHESTISKLDRQYVEMIKERNQLLFIWKNISDPWWRFSNISGISLRCLLGPNYLKVVWSAWRRYQEFGKPKVTRGKLSDKEVIDLFKND